MQQIVDTSSHIGLRHSICSGSIYGLGEQMHGLLLEGLYVQSLQDCKSIKEGEMADIFEQVRMGLIYTNA